MERSSTLLKTNAPLSRRRRMWMHRPRLTKTVFSRSRKTRRFRPSNDSSLKKKPSVKIEIYVCSWIWTDDLKLKIGLRSDETTPCERETALFSSFELPIHTMQHEMLRCEIVKNLCLLLQNSAVFYRVYFLRYPNLFFIPEKETFRNA